MLVVLAVVVVWCVLSVGTAAALSMLFRGAEAGPTFAELTALEPSESVAAA